MRSLLNSCSQHKHCYAGSCRTTLDNTMHNPSVGTKGVGGVKDIYIEWCEQMEDGSLGQGLTASENLHWAIVRSLHASKQVQNLKSVLRRHFQCRFSSMRTKRIPIDEEIPG